MDNDFQRPAARTERTPHVPESPHTVGHISSPPKKRRRFHIWPRHWSTKKKRISTAILVTILVLVAAGAGYWYYHTHRDKPDSSANTAQPDAPPPPTTEASNLTGEQVPIGTNGRQVIGVMVENSPDARPQAGLNVAGVVFEAVAEGGITRFLALYQEAQPDYIGPVRSARPYYLDWVLPFNAGYAHVGGSPDALAAIKALGVKDLDQFSNPGAYHRISQRYAPHNVYTSIGALDQVIQQRGYTGSNFTPFHRKEPAPSPTPNARTINMQISGPLYNVHYDYDPATNSYKRVMAGKPHTDERSGAQLSPKVVVALVVPSSIASDGVHTNYATVGSGTMFVFQDGTFTQGTWTKPDSKAQFTFTNADGTPLAFNPGQAWFTTIKDPASVTFAP